MKHSWPALSRPLRLQVFFHSPPGLPSERWPRPWWAGPRSEQVVAAVLDSGALFLEAAYPPADGAGRELFREMVRRSSSRGMSVSVTVTADDPAPVQMAAAGAREVLFDVTPLAATGIDPDRLESLLEATREAGAGAGISFRAGRKILSYLPGVLAAACGAGAAVLELPPVSLLYLEPAGRAEATPGPADYRRLEETFFVVAAPSGIPELRVHDVPLWLLLRRFPALAERLPHSFGGCQAGSALRHLAPDGAVYPCSALDLPLGAESSLVEDADPEDGAVQDLAALVAGAIAGCAGCPIEHACRGGCPATRLALGGGDGREPLCLHLREQAGEETRS